MSKIFEDYFSELQADMVGICLEYVNNDADYIYIYCSNEAGIIFCDHFYIINNKVLAKSRINEGLKKDSLKKHDTSAYVQDQVNEIVANDIRNIEKLCAEYNRVIPTEMKIIYNVKKNSLNADYSYDLKYSGDPEKTAYDVAMEWFNEIKQKYSE